jgi:hypothetical protein
VWRIAVLIVLAGGIAHADPSALFAEGRALLDAGHPAEACAKFEAALRGDPGAAGTMLNLGLCNRQLHRYATALRWFRKALADSSVGGHTEHETAAKDMTVELVALVPTLTIAVAGEATVTIDGQPIATTDFANVELDPGTHEVVAHAGGRVTTRSVALAERQHERISIDTGGAELPRSPMAMYVLIGSGVLGLAALGWDAAIVAPARSRLTDAPTQYAFESNKSAFDTDRTVAAVIYGAAAATLVAGIVLRARSPELLPIRIDATAGGATVEVAATW